MRARAFLPVFLFAVCLPPLGCIPHALPKTSPTRKVKDKAQKEDAVTEKKEDAVTEKKEDAVTEKKVELAGEEKKEDAINVDLSYLEKTWGIKCKSHRLGDSGNPYGKKVTFLLEFTKDVENLEELRAAFKPVFLPGIKGFGNCPLWFYFFDEDNVFVYKSPPNAIAGEVSGKKGDAIRVSIVGIVNDFNKIRKIEARPGEKEKDKDKPKK